MEDSAAFAAHRGRLPPGLALHEPLLHNGRLLAGPGASLARVALSLKTCPEKVFRATCTRSWPHHALGVLNPNKKKYQLNSLPSQ
eukprot:COSAG01_NODE_46946_length_395_cov_0.871622_1_plen_84_part_10